MTSHADTEFKSSWRPTRVGSMRIGPVFFDLRYLTTPPLPAHHENPYDRNPLIFKCDSRASCQFLPSALRLWSGGVAATPSSRRHARCIFQ
jgi:hypothetical protein